MMAYIAWKASPSLNCLPESREVVWPCKLICYGLLQRLVLQKFIQSINSSKPRSEWSGALIGILFDQGISDRLRSKIAASPILSSTTVASAGRLPKRMNTACDIGYENFTLDQRHNKLMTTFEMRTLMIDYLAAFFDENLRESRLDGICSFNPHCQFMMSLNVQINGNGI